MVASLVSYLPLMWLTTSCESLKTSNSFTYNSRVSRSPNNNASYSTLLLVALNSNWRTSSYYYSFGPLKTSLAPISMVADPSTCSVHFSSAHSWLSTLSVGVSSEMKSTNTRALIVVLDIYRMSNSPDSTDHLSIHPTMSNLERTY